MCEESKHTPRNIVYHNMRCLSELITFHTPHEYEWILRIPDKSIRRIGTIRPRASTSPRFLVGVFVHSTNTCPMRCRGYSPKGRILSPCFGEGIRPGDEYFPNVLGRVFVQGTNTCPLCWRGYSSMGRILAPCFREGVRPTDEYLPHDLEMVFVHGRILASCCGETSIRQKPTNNLIYAFRILFFFFISLHYLPLLFLSPS